MNDQHDSFWAAAKVALSSAAAVLGIGTAIGWVNLFVGILSACWLGYQLYVGIRYELPVKRAKLQAALREAAGEHPPEVL